MAQITVVTFAKIKQIIGEKQFSYIGNSVEDVLNKLFMDYDPILKEELVGENGKIKKHYRILVNGRNINLLEGYSTKLKDDDMIVIMPAIAGG